MVLYASINNKKELKLSEEIDSINVQSGNKNYEQGEEGAWNLEKSAKWTGFHKAQITFDFDSIPKMKEHFEDILLVIDISGSMEGDKIDRVKSDSINLVEKILTNSSNRMGIITFSDESSMALDLTNNKLDIINKINNLSTVNNTNYYQALVNIERFFKNYQKEDNKDLVILFLTDGFPNQDTPNQEAQYKILKEQYPFVEIIGIQYEMGEDILEPIIRVSDGKYIADMDSLNNVLYAASNLTEKFEKVEIVDYINDDFKIESEEDIIPSVGSVKLEDENGKQKVIWTINSNMLSTGANANLKINVTLKEGSYNKEYVVTNDREEITVKLPNESEEKQEKQMNPTLKNKYTVTYNGNSPSDCSISNVPNIKSYSPYETVSIEQDAKCNNYNFKGWLIKNSNITKQSSKTFVMPEDNVDLVGRWGTLGVNKTQDGSVYKLLLSGYLISEANDSSVVEYSTGNKKEMFTFSHESTNQTDALTDYRYIGNEPNNYIYFNCTDGNDTSTCEKWRIIGVFEVEDENGNKEQRVKIIREYLYSNMSWTSSSNSNNNWVTSKINENLNSGNFYNSLTDGAKELIGKSKYYLASGVYDTTTHYGSGDDIYNWERSNQVNGSNPKYWIGDIGLMYPSDYTYTFAKGVNDYCFNDIYNCRNYNPTYSWIYNTNRYSASGSISDQWLITSNSQDSMYSFIIYSSGYVIGSYYILTSHQIRPVLYLSSSVQYVDGDGSIDNPYVISK